MLPVHRPILQPGTNRLSPSILNCPGAFFLSANFSFYFSCGLLKCFNFSFYFGSGLLKCFKLTSRFVFIKAFWFAKPAYTHHSIFGVCWASSSLLVCCQVALTQSILGLVNEWACAVLFLYFHFCACQAASVFLRAIFMPINTF